MFINFKVKKEVFLTKRFNLFLKPMNYTNLTDF